MWRAYMNIPMGYGASPSGIVKQRCPTPKHVHNEGEIGLKCAKPGASLCKTYIIIRTLIL